MYPAQAVDEIDRAVRSLNEQSLALKSAVLSRLDRSKSHQDACRSFLGKWEERLSKEKTSWKERGLSVSALGHALPE